MAGRERVLVMERRGKGVRGREGERKRKRHSTVNGVEDGSANIASEKE